MCTKDPYDRNAHASLAGAIQNDRRLARLGSAHGCMPSFALWNPVQRWAHGRHGVLRDQRILYRGHVGIVPPPWPWLHDLYAQTSAAHLSALPLRTSLFCRYASLEVDNGRRHAVVLLYHRMAADAHPDAMANVALAPSDLCLFQSNPVCSSILVAQLRGTVLSGDRCNHGGVIPVRLANYVGSAGLDDSCICMEPNPPFHLVWVFP